jgi:hypothetical protein
MARPLYANCGFWLLICIILLALALFVSAGYKVYKRLMENREQEQEKEIESGTPDTKKAINGSVEAVIAFNACPFMASPCVEWRYQYESFAFIIPEKAKEVKGVRVY